MLVSNQDQVLVLKDREALNKDRVSLSFSQAVEDEFAVSSQFPYQQWFDLVKPDALIGNAGNREFKCYRSRRNRFGTVWSGHGICRRYPIDQFPQYTAYYFAGDFAQMDFSGTFWNYAGFARIKQLFSVANPNAETKFYWGCYVPLMQKIISDLKTRPEVTAVQPETTGTQMAARTADKGFQVFSRWQLGRLLCPGSQYRFVRSRKWFTEFSYDEALYLKWFEQIGAMNANTIRVYTLLPPQFYSALVYYNEKSRR